MSMYVNIHTDGAAELTVMMIRSNELGQYPRITVGEVTWYGTEAEAHRLAELIVQNIPKEQVHV